MFRYLSLMTVLLCAMQIGCRPSVPSVANPNISYDPYSHAAVNYFSEIGFGSEYGENQGQNVIVKWGSGMSVYISHANPEDASEARKITDELAQLTGLSINFTNQPLTEESFPHNTIHISYTTQDEFHQLCGKERYEKIVKLHGEQKGFFCNDWDDVSYVITRAHVLIDNTIQNQNQRNHLLREELTQSFGIMKDSNSYTDSVFHASYSYAPTEFSELDKQVIQILYDKKISPGMTLNQVEQALQTTSQPAQIAKNPIPKHLPVYLPSTGAQQKNHDRQTLLLRVYTVL